MTRLLGFLLGAGVGTVTGFVAGAFFGGNYATSFEFAGLRGYEATAPLGAVMGFVLFGLLGAWIARRGASGAPIGRR
jgi:hypothetical protein